MPRNHARRPDDKRLHHTAHPMTLDEFYQRAGEIPVYAIGDCVQLAQEGRAYPIIGIEQREDRIWMCIDCGTTTQPAPIYRLQAEIRKLNPVMAKPEREHRSHAIRIAELERELCQTREMLERERQRHAMTREHMLEARDTVARLRGDNHPR